MVHDTLCPYANIDSTRERYKLYSSVGVFDIPNILNSMYTIADITWNILTLI